MMSCSRSVIAAILALAIPLTAGFGAGILSGTGAARAQTASPVEEALLAIEEAELRERIAITLAIAESVRLRGRTILVAMSEIGRVRRRVERLDPTSSNKAEFEARLTALERRRIELDAEVDEEFLAYLELVSDLGNDLWSRVDRVGEELRQGLAARRIARLAGLYPVVRAHIEEFNRSRSITRAMTDRWRQEIDDTYQMRQERLRAAPAPEPSLTDQQDKEEDI